MWYDMIWTPYMYMYVLADNCQHWTAYTVVVLLKKNYGIQSNMSVVS